MKSRQDPLPYFQFGSPNSLNNITFTIILRGALVLLRRTNDVNKFVDLNIIKFKYLSQKLVIFKSLLNKLANISKTININFLERLIIYIYI